MPILAENKGLFISFLAIHEQFFSFLEQYKNK